MGICGKMLTHPCNQLTVRILTIVPQCQVSEKSFTRKLTIASICIKGHGRQLQRYDIDATQL
jgi:hypothetical protein